MYHIFISCEISSADSFWTFFLNHLSGSVIIDVQEETLPDIARCITTEMLEDHQIDNYSATCIRWALELRHKYFREGSAISKLRNKAGYQYMQ